MALPFISYSRASTINHRVRVEPGAALATYELEIVTSCQKGDSAVTAATDAGCGRALSTAPASSEHVLTSMKFLR